MITSKKKLNKKTFLNFRKIVSQTKNTQFSLPLIKIVWVSFLIGFITLLTVILSQKYLPPQVPLFYGLPEGENQLSSSWGLAIPGAVSLIITGLNLLICLFLENRFLQKSLILSSLTVSIFSFVTTIKILFLVGSF